MKVIDLLNKIANGEEVPKKIKVGIFDFYRMKKETIKNDYDYQNEDGTYLMDYLNEYNYITSYLNDEVEIIDEENEFIDIEELNLDTDELLKKVIITAQDYVLEGKINQLIQNQKKIIERLDK